MKPWGEGWGYELGLRTHTAPLAAGCLRGGVLGYQEATSDFSAFPQPMGHRCSKRRLGIPSSINQDFDVTFKSISILNHIKTNVLGLGIKLSGRELV